MRITILCFTLLCAGLIYAKEFEINADKLREQITSQCKLIEKIQTGEINYTTEAYTQKSHQDDENGNKKTITSQRVYFDATRKCAKVISSPETIEKYAAANQYYSNGVLYQIRPKYNQITITKRAWEDTTIYGSVIDIKAAGRCYGIPLDDKQYSLSRAVLEGKDMIHLVFSWLDGARTEFYLEDDPPGMVSKRVYYTKNEDVTLSDNYWDFQDIGGIQFPMRWKFQQISKNRKMIGTFEFLSIKFNPDLSEENFVPKDFGMCLVVDERFNPPLQYHAKGQLPSDEQVVLFSQDKKALRQYEDEIESLNK
jgi:hypothetical protein